MKLYTSKTYFSYDRDGKRDFLEDFQVIQKFRNRSTSSTLKDKRKRTSLMGSLGSLFKTNSEKDLLLVPEVKTSISAPNLTENTKVMVMVFIVGGVTPTEIR